MTAFAWYLRTFHGKNQDEKFLKAVEGNRPLDRFYVPHSKNCPALFTDFRDGDSPCKCGLTALADAQLAKFLILRAKWHAELLLSTVQAILRALLSTNRQSLTELHRDIAFEGHKYRSLRRCLYWPVSKDRIAQPLPQELVHRIQGAQVSFPEKQSQASGTDQVKA